MPGLTPSGRKIVVPVSVGVIGLALIGIGQGLPNRHSIEDDLTTRSQDALSEAQLTGLDVAFTGRDATITGSSSAELTNRAVTTVEGVKGVRVATANRGGGETAAAGTPTPTAAVTTSAAETTTAAETPEPSETSTPAAAPTETPGPTAKPAMIPVGFTLTDGTITVTGTVKSESARAALIAATKAAGNGWKVVDRLTIDESMKAPAPKSNRLPAVTKMLATAPTGGSKLVIQYARSKVLLRGTPADSKTEFALLKAARATVAKKTDVFDGLDVP